jgi:hypothetical protein
MVKCYIRGKPWYVTVDDYFMFKTSGTPNKLVFAKVATDYKSMWAAIIEKAFSKVRGQMVNAEGGFTAGAIRYLTNIPVFSYSTTDITT